MQRHFRHTFFRRGFFSSDKEGHKEIPQICTYSSSASFWAIYKFPGQTSVSANFLLMVFVVYWIKGKFLDKDAKKSEREGVTAMT